MDRLVREPMPLVIVYRDDHLIAIHKPAGLLVHRSSIDRHETSFAMQLLRDQIGQPVYPVHRLDKPTSGVLLFALNPEAARLLGALFAGAAVAKTYLAVVRGVPSRSGIIDSPLREERNRYDDQRTALEKAPQSAVTRFQTRATVELPFAVGPYPTSRYALVEVQPQTGRRHQIRRHFKHLCHPLIGDTKYGEGRHNRFFRDHFGCQRLLLAAVELQLNHPVNGMPLVITSPLEENFRELVTALGWDGAVASPCRDGVAASERCLDNRRDFSIL